MFSQEKWCPPVAKLVRQVLNRMAFVLVLTATPFRWAHPATWRWVVWAGVAMLLAGVLNRFGGGSSGRFGPLQPLPSEGWGFRPRRCARYLADDT